MKDSDWQILYELYKTPNMTKVASRLYITQPSLTKRLQAMEEEFQIKIVNRTTKGVEFTREGEVLAQKAQQYLVFMKGIRRELRQLKGNKREIITIGSSYTYNKYVLPEILFEYSKDHSDIRFEVLNEQSNLLFRKACDGEVDVAFVQGDYKGAVLQRRVDEYQAYILTKECIQLEDLPHMSRINYKSNDRSKELLNNWWETHYNLLVPAGMSVGYVDVAWQLVSKGLGYTCCFLPENYENPYNLVLTPMENLDGTPLKRNTWFVYRDVEKRSEGLKDFIAYINKKIVLK
ncbi:LysR family transcriptional regulator [Irregularibacter muris]|uniref:LysR family transcriptional regulator n=1 Tax=Irregularibacter muris TaxID=1796619 RepID=A0AAE3L3Z5_9FIRM|nr:LysR family transcriptional regulator [Irregularibacter muris]MCR1899133.1 LysR family transcriptional regulator [Irregularibacter muris]